MVHKLGRGLQYDQILGLIHQSFALGTFLSCIIIPLERLLLTIHFAEAVPVYDDRYEHQLFGEHQFLRDGTEMIGTFGHGFGYI